MDGNYEAQRHLVRERLADRRRQGEVERMLKTDRSQRPGLLSRFLGRLFGPSAEQPVQGAVPQVDRPVRSVSQIGEG